MSAQYDAYGNPATVGDPGREDAVYDTVGIAQSISDVRTLALYDLARARLVRQVVATVPAAGAEWSQTVPAGVIWELLAVRFTFTTSAVVANRHGPVIVDDGATEYYRASWNAAQAASIAGTFALSAGVGAAYGASNFNTLPLPSPPLALPQGHRIRTSTVNIDAGDAYTAILLTVREWSVGQVYWAADLLGRELGFESLTDLPASTPVPVETGQPIPVSPIAR